MKIESGIRYIRVIIVKHIGAVSFPNYLFFAGLLDQIHDTNRTVQCELLAKMLLKCHLRFSLVCVLTIEKYQMQLFVFYKEFSRSIEMISLLHVYLCQFLVVVYICIPVATNTLEHFLVLVRKTLDDRGTKLAVQFQHNSHTCRYRPLRVFCTCVTLYSDVFNRDSL